MMKKKASLIVCFLVIPAIFPLAISIDIDRNISNTPSQSIMGTMFDEENLPNEIDYNRVIENLPLYWNWRNVDGNDWTTPIKDQLQDVCGSCWAFGALGGLESMVKIWENNSDLDVDLSEQYMLSCSCSPGDCGGWYWMQTLSWIKNHGAIPESCLSYEADDTILCDAKCSNWHELIVGIDSYHHVTSNISMIQSALIEYGPLPATMDVYEDFYPNYEGGVYEYTWGDYVFGHCITIVGYDDVLKCWIVKNSWGTEWGEDGWFRIAYGQCKIEKGVYYYVGPNYASVKPDAPVGPNEGTTEETYTYSAVASDPDGDIIKYHFNWGDGNTTISSFVSSGEMISVDYSWDEQGTYEIRVKTQDEHGLESAYSDPLIVSMPKNKNIRKNIVLHRLQGYFNLLQNYPSILLI